MTSKINTYIISSSERVEDSRSKNSVKPRASFRDALVETLVNSYLSLARKVMINLKEIILNLRYKINKISKYNK